MLNNFVIVGKISSIKSEEEKAILMVNVPRPYKNVDGNYEDDLIKVLVMKNLSNTLNEYCKTDDVIGIRGKIQGENMLVAEKISFLSSKN